MADSKIPEKYAELARKWLDGTATLAEQEEYNNWFAEFDNQGLVIPYERGTNDEELSSRLFARVMDQIPENRNLRPMWISVAVAASVIIALLSAGGLFYWKYKQGSKTQLATTTISNEIYFAGDKATLELADGSQVKLDQIANGTKLSQGSTILSKHQDKVVYQSDKVTNDSPTYNVIRVPRGGRFHVVLSDGTQAWLNSESSLKFPVAFSGTTRLVELTGEAYFEVAKSKNNDGSIPFKVNVNHEQTVEVLGTHFNVMAYNQEAAVRTTLIEGSVKVSEYGSVKGVILKPLQQSEYSGGAYKIKSGIDPIEAISWKEGLIRYKDADIQTIMRQIERWYDVDVSYDGEIPRRSFNGGISRTSSLSQILKILEMNDIHVRKDGRRLVVLPEYLPN